MTEQDELLYGGLRGKPMTFSALRPGDEPPIKPWVDPPRPTLPTDETVEQRIFRLSNRILNRQQAFANTSRRRK